MSKPSDVLPSFSDRLGTILNNGALNLALGIGYATGLLDVLDQMTKAATVSDISKASGLQPRYITEWLSVMVCGEIITLSTDDEGENRYFLPQEHGDLLCRRAGENNLGVYTQEIPILTVAAMDAVIDRFQHGDGVTYDHYIRFQRFMGELADAKHRRTLVQAFLPSIEKGLLCQRLRAGIDVCDIGCGHGLAVQLMARAYPNSRFVGIDFSKEAIEAAQTASRQAKLGNVRFVCRDLAAMEAGDGFDEHFDYITAFDAIHDQTNPLQALKNTYGMLKRQGRFSMIDIAAESELAANRDHPMGTFMYTVSLMHCMPVGMVENGAGLGMMWGRKCAQDLLKEAGFESIQVLPIANDPFNDHFLCRKP